MASFTPTCPANKIINTNLQGRRIGLLAFICAVFFTLTIIFAHAVTDSMVLWSDTLSRYALEKYGYILELGFFSIGLTQLLIAFLLYNQTKIENLKPAAILLFLSGIGAIIVAIFPTQLPPASITERLPHIIGAVMQFLFFPIAILLVSKKHQGGAFKTYTLLSAIITALLFAIMTVLFFTPSMKNFAYFGLIEKVDILTINFWLILMAFTLYKPPLTTKQGAL